jgi:hypothetical protein
MLDAAKIRVCPVVDTRVPDWSACRDTALPLKLAPEEKLLAYKRSFSYLSELDAPLCHGLYAQMERNIGDKVFGATNLNRNHWRDARSTPGRVTGRAPLFNQERTTQTPFDILTRPTLPHSLGARSHVVEPD